MTSHTKIETFIEQLKIASQNAGPNADLMVLFSNNYTTTKHKGQEVEFRTDVHADNRTVFLHLKPINEPSETLLPIIGNN